MIKVGEQIKAIRLRRGYNQEQLAEMASLNRVTIAKYESGKVEPGAQALARIADALEVTVDELLGRNIVSTEDWNPDDMNYADREDETIKIMTRGMKRMPTERRSNRTGRTTRKPRNYNVCGVFLCPLGCLLLSM